MTKRKSVSQELPWEGESSFGKGSFKRCYESHPALIIGDQKIYGGSCSSPMIKDADIYVGLDLSHAKSAKAYPWEPGESFLFHIQDMHAPTDTHQFQKLIEYLAMQLTANKKIHVGCIGGHGRTGTVLAALVAVMLGEKDAITYVRENYCQKAVESTSQVDFLVKQFGIKEVAGHKAKPYGTTTGRWSAQTSNVKEFKKPEPAQMPSGVREVVPMQNPISIWGQAVLFDKPEQSGIIKA